MNIDIKTIKHIAKLSKLSIDESEIDQLTKDISHIISFVEKINEVDTAKIEPLANVLDETNVWREDHIGDSLPVKMVEKLAPKSESGHIVVPAVIE